MYITIQDMIDMGFITAGQYPDEVVGQKIFLAQKMVEAYTGRVFESRYFSFIRTGGQYFYSFDFPPISILVYGKDGSSKFLYQSSEYEVLDIRTPSEEAFCVHFFSEPYYDEVVFEGNFGLLEAGLTPYPIKYLTGKLTYYLLEPSLYVNLNLYGVSSESADGHSVSYNGHFLIGDIEMDGIIRMYRKQSLEIYAGLV